MFNNKLKKRIEELERRMDESDSKIITCEKDTFTKNIHLRIDMVGITGEYEFIKGVKFPKDFYFLKGTEPKCDYILKKLDGSLEFYKNNVSCDKKGQIKK